MGRQSGGNCSGRQNPTIFVAECRGVPLPASAEPAIEPSKGQFAIEAEAKGSCPTDTVVWVNLRSKIYHVNGRKSYGTTKSGAYMCERTSTEAGFRASKPFRPAANS
jgi:hypothetical protein